MSLLYTTYVFAGLNEWNIIYHCLLGFQIQGWAQLKVLGKLGSGLALPIIIFPAYFLDVNLIL